MIFMLFIVFISKDTNRFSRSFHQLLENPIQLIATIVAGYVITLNWGAFVWAVTNGHVLQSNLGYYINPLVSILLAFIFLRERFNKLEWIAIVLASIGVFYITFINGAFPIVSIILALTFGSYGLLKKIVKIDTISSITIECIMTAPAGIIYLLYIWQQSGLTFGLNASSFWLLSSGALTAVPLMLFSAGIRRIQLSLTGFIQYIVPTIMFILGILVFKESFDTDQFIAFLFIWLGIIVYSISQYKKTNT